MVALNRNKKTLLNACLFGSIVCTLVVAPLAIPTANAAPKASGKKSDAKAEARPQTPAEAKKAAEASAGEVAAKQLLDRALDLITSMEGERGVKMLETILEQYPQSQVRYKAYLGLGRYYIGIRDQAKAIGYLRNLRSMENPDKELTGEPLDTFLEGLYLTGVAYFDMRQYPAAFPVLRKITNDYPNTVWANQAHYYMGMCHFAQQNWNKAIESLSLVGTFIDAENSTKLSYAEAGRRFYVKIADADLPVLARLGNKVVVTLETTGGDKESLECIALPGNDAVFVGSIPTEIGVGVPGNGTIEVVGGDKIISSYTDFNTDDGTANVTRKVETRVVSSGAPGFTLGDYETRTVVAYQGQALSMTLFDADLDKTEKADTVQVKVVSRFKPPEDDKALAANADSARMREEDRWKVRDEVMVTLTEQPKVVKAAIVVTTQAAAAPAPAPVRAGTHTGRFAGQVMVAPFREDQQVDRTDGQLVAAVGDEVVVTYVDELHIAGELQREVTDKATVVSEIDSRPHATQYLVSDPVVAAKKNIVESTAFLELGRIFKSMGLTKGAKEKAVEGLDRVDSIIRARTPIPPSLTEQAFKTKWELQLVMDDFTGAIATCELFNRLYPESPFVDQALMGIGTVKMADRQYVDAMNIFRRVLGLPHSQAKAEAQFRIAEATELSSNKNNGGAESAIAQYKLCAERYPDSEFAGPSLAKLTDYYIEAKDYAQANDLLGQIFQDHPDEAFLDGMLLKWVIVAYRMGDYQKAHDKCTQLLFEYPDSAFAEKAKAILPRIEDKLKK